MSRRLAGKAEIHKRAQFSNAHVEFGIDRGVLAFAVVAFSSAGPGNQPTPATRAMLATYSCKTRKPLTG
jgi:hypothetical protein